MATWKEAGFTRGMLRHATVDANAAGRRKPPECMQYAPWCTVWWVSARGARTAGVNNPLGNPGYYYLAEEKYSRAEERFEYRNLQNLFDRINAEPRICTCNQDLLRLP